MIRRFVLVVAICVASPAGSELVSRTVQVRAGEGTQTEATAKRPLKKLALRLFLRGQLRRKDLSDEQRTGIQAALRDGKLLDALGEECDAMVAQGEIAVDWRSFLQWLLDNADEIIALILKLLPLFMESG